MRNKDKDIEIIVKINHPPSDKALENFNKILNELIEENNLIIHKNS